ALARLPANPVLAATRSVLHGPRGRSRPLTALCATGHATRCNSVHSRPGMPGKALFGAGVGRGPIDWDRLSHVEHHSRAFPLSTRHNRPMSDSSTETDTRRPWALAVFLIVTGALGWWAAFSLTLDK